MLIRPETPADYATIADIHTRAFDNHVEPSIVALLRQRGGYDPELSLVAEMDGQVVGHALYTPTQIRLLSTDLNAVLLAPIGVHPTAQKMGIGKELMDEGHRVAKAKGYPLAFLLGHPTYYPRFGYITGVYGSSELTVTPVPIDMSLETRSPVADDVPALIDLWRHEEGDVDFALFPGDSLLDWVSLNRANPATVYLRDGEIVGYTRGESHKPLMFLARDHDSARAMVAILGANHDSVTLPLHPRSVSTGAFETKPTLNAWKAGMALPLTPSPFDDYWAQVQNNTHPVGRVIWTVQFEI